MISNKFNITKLKFISIVLAFAILFSSAHILASELGNCVAEAAVKNAEDEQDAVLATYASPISDSKSYTEELFMPNYDTEVITQTNLPKPKVETFGKHDVSYYPSYTNQLANADFDNAKKTEILTENQEIIANANKWFSEGTLKENLQKHVSADGQFYNKKGNYDNAPRIEKQIAVNTKIAARKRSLGVFAPAGEILTVTIDESLVGKLTVNIGYPYNGECSIDSGAFGRWKNDRMAQMFMSFKLNSTVTEIGSPFGGMVTLDGVGSLGNFTITVRGGVDMPDYKLGVSTKEDWKNILAAPAPYVWLLTPYQYFVMPKVEIADIEDPYNAMLWWHKVSMISMYSMAREKTDHFYTPVISIYDSYVYVGEAVAKTWAFVTNSPTYWCHGMLDYDNLMANGAWGAIHEYNHHHQAHSYSSAEWGIGGRDEMTNNVVNTLSYVLLTDIATTRSESNILGVWNGVSDPYCNYKLLDNVSKNKSTYEGFDTHKLFGFVDMIHTFGAEKFIDFLRAQYGYGEVEGYTGKNLTQDGYLTTMDGFTLFASLFFKTDFVDYFTKVWHFVLSQEVIDEIKSYNFDEYFSINNLYSSGIKGIETGRAYKINVGTTNVLKFNQYTLCSTDDYVLESVSEPQHGKLTDNGDGTYNYTPDSDFTQDSFDLVYKVTLNGRIYYRTLAVKLTANYSYIETVTYNVEAGKTGLSAEQAIAEFAKEDNIVASGTANNFTATTMNGVNLVSFKAKVVFPFTKQLKFMVYGDDKSWLRIDDQTAFTSTYIGNDNAGKNHATNKIDVLVTAGKPMEFEAYCFNTGGAGNLRVKYSEDGGETYKDIPSSYCFGYNVTNADIEKSRQTTTNVYPAYVDFRSLYLQKWYADAIGFTPVKAECLDDNGNPVRTVNGADITRLFDGDTSTGFHTAWQGTITSYPHNYYFTFEEPVQFNRLDMFFQGNSNYYAIGDYDILVSNDGEEYELVYSGSNRGGNFAVKLGTAVSAKYVKLVVKSNASGQKFTNILEIKFLFEKDYGLSYNIYASTNSLLSYEGNTWQDVQGNYINTVGKHASSGTLKFYLTGTDLMLYSVNKQSTIKIDGVPYSIRENGKELSPSFIVDGLDYGKHLIEIDANDMTVDIIKTSGQISELVDFGKIQIDVGNQYYNGRALNPSLSYNGIDLIEGVDYEITSIQGNLNVGTATFAIKALGGNKGTYEGNFEIMPVHLDNTNVSFVSMEDYLYTGENITLDFTIMLYLDDGVVVLKEGIDYDVTYLNNKEVGVASIVLTFKGNFSGNATGYFNIVNLPADVPENEPNNLWKYIVGGLGAVFAIGILAAVISVVKKKKS